MLLRWALVFFIFALIAAVFGFGGIAGGAISIAKVLFYVFASLFIVALVVNALARQGIFGTPESS